MYRIFLGAGNVLFSIPREGLSQTWESCEREVEKILESCGALDTDDSKLAWEAQKRIAYWRISLLSAWARGLAAEKVRSGSDILNEVCEIEECHATKYVQSLKEYSKSLAGERKAKDNTDQVMNVLEGIYVDVLGERGAEKVLNERVEFAHTRKKIRRHSYYRKRIFSNFCTSFGREEDISKNLKFISRELLKLNRLVDRKFKKSERGVLEFYRLLAEYYIEIYYRNGAEILKMEKVRVPLREMKTEEGVEKAAISYFKDAWGEGMVKGRDWKEFRNSAVNGVNWVTFTELFRIKKKETKSKEFKKLVGARCKEIKSLELVGGKTVEEMNLRVTSSRAGKLVRDRERKKEIIKKAGAENS